MTSDLRSRVEAWLSTQVDSLGGQFHLVRVSDLRALLAEPAAEDEAWFETPGDAVYPDAPSDPAPAADGGEVEALANVLGDIRVADAREAEWWTSDEDHHLLIRVLRGECIPWAEGLIASDWLADLRRTERAEGAREAAERIAAAILMACCHFDRYKGQPEACGYCETAADIARAATEPTTDRPGDGVEVREVGGCG